MRVYDLEQGRSVERLDGHARIKPLPTKLFTPGQRVFTPRYRLFIPSSTNLPPAVMLRFDRPLQRSVGPAARLPSRLPRRPNLVVAKDQAAQRPLSVKTPRSSGFWLMRNWRKLRSRRSRMETYCLSRLPPRSGCDVAVLAVPFRGRVSQRPCRRLGSQSRENAMSLARTTASSATAPPAQWPRQLHGTTDRNRGCTRSGTGGGLPVRRHHRSVADQDRPNRR
jgi:hypothetical protein